MSTPLETGSTAVHVTRFASVPGRGLPFGTSYAIDAPAPPGETNQIALSEQEAFRAALAILRDIAAERWCGEGALGTLERIRDEIPRAERQILANMLCPKR